MAGSGTTVGYGEIDICKNDAMVTICADQTAATAVVGTLLRRS